MKSAQSGVILSMLAVFGSGIVVGAFGYHSYSVKTVNATVATQPPRRNPDEWRRIFVEEMRTRLQLDSGQLTRLNTVLDETRNHFRSLKDKQKQEADEARDSIRSAQHQKILAMLNDTQKVDYEKFREERDRKMKAELAAREQAAKAQAGKAGN